MTFRGSSPCTCGLTAYSAAYAAKTRGSVLDLDSSLPGGATKALNRFGNLLKDKYPRAVGALEKDKEALLAFYDLPAVYWLSLRTAKLVESTFGAMRHRAMRSKGCVSHTSMLAFLYNVTESATNPWNSIVYVPSSPGSARYV